MISYIHFVDLIQGRYVLCVGGCRNWDINPKEIVICPRRCDQNVIGPDSSGRKM